MIITDTVAINYQLLKRGFDFVLALVLVLLLMVPMLLVMFAVRFSSKGPVLYWSERIGSKSNEKLSLINGTDEITFFMPKFRTMLVDTPAVATNLLVDPDRFLTPIGGFLRKSSLDEMPQLWSILKGDMSFVGPRPALFNQDDLIALRTENGVDCLIPGLTGWAQVNGRDELPIQEKVALDVEYMEMRSFCFDMKILWMTVLRVIRRDGVSH